MMCQHVWINRFTLRVCGSTAHNLLSMWMKTSVACDHSYETGYQAASAFKDVFYRIKFRIFQYFANLPTLRKCYCSVSKRRKN